MIIKRKLFNEKVITLYHAARNENVQSILKNGLKASMAEGKDSSSSRTGLPKEVLKNKIYLSRSLENFEGMNFNKRTILKIEVPENVFKAWKDVGDPIRSYFKNKYEWAKHWIDWTKRNRPDAYKKYGKNRLYEMALIAWDNVDPKRIMVIEKDIPAKYISVL